MRALARTGLVSGEAAIAIGSAFLGGWAVLSAAEGGESARVVLDSGGGVLALFALWFAGRSVVDLLGGRFDVRREGIGPRVRVVAYLAASTIAAAVVAEPVWEPVILRSGALASLASLALLPRRSGESGWLGRSRLVRVVDLALFNVILLLVLAECGLAIAARIFPSPIFVRGRGEGRELIDVFRLPPGGDHYGCIPNSRGFADEEFTIEKAPGVFRIEALGDSFCVGIVPPQFNFLRLLEERLRRGRGDRGKGGLEVYNFGIGATDPQDYFLLHSTEARAYGADLVLLHVFVGNDIGPVDPPRFLDPERWYIYSVPKRLFAVWEEAKRRGVAMKDVARATGAAAATGSGAVDYHGDWRLEQAALSEERFFTLELSRVFACHVKRRREYRDTFEILSRLVSSADVPVVLVLIPDEYQVNDAVWEEIFGRHPWIERAKFDREKPQKEFARFCEEEGIPMIDLLPALRRGQAEFGRVYHLRDTHWNAGGNRIAADQIAAFLEKWLEEHGE